MTENYFPLTYGGLKTDRFHAMQYGTEQAGMALVYKRENVKETSYTVKLNGLDPNAAYAVWDYDAPDDVQTLTGQELMQTGIAFAIPDAPKAMIVRYEMK